MKRLLSLLLLLVCCSPLRAATPEDLSWTLDYGPPTGWRAAVEELCRGEKGLPAKAVASLLRRQGTATGSLRLAMVKALANQGVSRDPRVLAFLHREILTGAPQAASIALEGLIASPNPEALPILVELFRVRSDWQTKLAEPLLKAARRRSGEAVHGPDGGSHAPHEATGPASTGWRDPVIYPFYQQLIAHPDRKLRYRAADALRYFADERSEGLLWDLTRDADPEVSLKALWSLGRRRNPAACDALFQHFWNGSGTDAQQGLVDTGEVCGPTHLVRYFALVETVAAQRRQDAITLLDAAVGSALLPLLEQDAFRRQMEQFSTSAAPEVRRQARWLLEQAADLRREQFLARRPPLLAPAVLVLLALVSALLGLVLFVWGFRLLHLLRLLRRTAPSKVHSAHQGTVLLQGRLKSDGGLLRHPLTDEACLYYSGADRDAPQHRFLLADETGTLRVQPASAVLLSSDGLLLEDEEVMILGRMSRGEDGQNVLGKPQLRRGPFERILHLLVQGVLGHGNHSGSAKALFSDPRRCFWIWKGEGQGPLHSRRELVRLFLVFLFAGAWISLFAAAALAMIDLEFSAKLADWLRSAG